MARPWAVPLAWAGQDAAVREGVLRDPLPGQEEAAPRARHRSHALLRSCRARVSSD